MTSSADHRKDAVQKVSCKMMLRGQTLWTGSRNASKASKLVTSPVFRLSDHAINDLDDIWINIFDRSTSLEVADKVI